MKSGGQDTHFYDQNPKALSMGGVKKSNFVNKRLTVGRLVVVF